MIIKQCLRPPKFHLGGLVSSCGSLAFSQNASSSSGENCRLLFIGDKAQLPPVGIDISPANDINVLKHSFNLTVASFEMTEVMRQALESGILYNATELRKRISEPNHDPDWLVREEFDEEVDFENFDYELANEDDDKDPMLPLFKTKGFKDVNRIEPQDFEELLQQSFNGRSSNEAVVICRSNKRANMFNQAIRARVLQEDGEISTGDLRWFYTAVTRAQEKLYFVNFKEEYFF